jgi:sugar/nucleoside kinase (ribokinase family)
LAEPAVIALAGNLARDIFGRGDVRVGGAPLHAAVALERMGIAAHLYARCAVADREALFTPLEALGSPATYIPGQLTAVFLIEQQPSGRAMSALAIGDSWGPEAIAAIPPEVRWLHVAPLLRSDFPASTIAQLAQGRTLSLDGQGLVRRSQLGPLELDADFDRALLGHISILKLSEEEAAVIGDLAGLGVPEVLLTRGPAGATVISNGSAVEVAADPVGGHHTGTGDAFAIAYLAARAGGLSAVPAAREATALVSELLSSLA